MILKHQIQQNISEHYSRIKNLKNSNDQYKHENINLLSKEYQELKKQLKDLNK